MGYQPKRKSGRSLKRTKQNVRVVNEKARTRKKKMVRLEMLQVAKNLHW